MSERSAKIKWLSQAYRLDQRINSKIDQMEHLRALATRITSHISDTPVSGSHNDHKMEDTIVKIIDLENNINMNIDRLVDLKHDIMEAITAVEEPDLQLLLEKRYLNFQTWEQIAVDMNYSIDYVYKLHRQALDKVKIAKRVQ